MKDFEDDPMHLPPGTRVGAYVIRGRLGRGTGSYVYEAESQLGNAYALKVSRYLAGPPNSIALEMDERFTRNVVCLEQLRDVRWVARIVAHDRYPDPRLGRQYLVQELVPKPELAPRPEEITDWAKRTSPSLRKLVTVFMQLADACEEMRLAGIQNRDLKPENILMTPDGEPRLIDFNSAIWHRAPKLTRPSARAIPTTLAYLPPEVAVAQLEEKKTGREAPFIWTPGADLYALGVVFYRILTGEHPFNLGIPLEEMLQEIAFLDPAHPMELQPVPFGLNKAVMRLLAKDPEERYQEGDELVGDLETLLRMPYETWDEPYHVPRTDRHEHGDVGGVPFLGALDGLADTVAPRQHRTTPRARPSTPTPETALVPAGAVPGRPPATAWSRSPVLLLPASRRPRARWLGGGAAAAVLLIGAGVALGLRSRSAPHSQPIAETTLAPAGGAQAKGTDVSSSVPEPSPAPVKRAAPRAPKAVVLTAAAALTGLACPSIKVRPDEDLQWLASCPAEARETVRALGLIAGSPDDEGPIVAQLPKGPNVIPHHAGCEIKEGPVEVPAWMAPSDYSGTLVGTVIAGTDRVHFRFHELDLPDGRKLPICGIGADSFLAFGPGVGLVAKDDPDRAPASELHPGFLYITTGRFRVRLAPYLPNRAQPPPGVN